MSEPRLQKFTLDKGGNTPARQVGTFRQVDFDGTPALKIGVPDGAIALVREIVSRWPPPFALLYVLIVTRSEQPKGRYQSPFIEDPAELDRTLARFEEFFEQDARHALWVTSGPGKRTVVYDRHERLFVYGDLPMAERLAAERGYRRGEASVAVPHAHHYHRHFDPAFDALMGLWEWRPSPLEPGDR